MSLSENSQLLLRIYKQLHHFPSSSLTASESFKDPKNRIDSFKTGMISF